jgi:hypothetical protein
MNVTFSVALLNLIMTLFIMLARSSDSGDQAINHSGLNESASKIK